MKVGDMLYDGIECLYRTNEWINVNDVVELLFSFDMIEENTEALIKNLEVYMKDHLEVDSARVCATILGLLLEDSKLKKDILPVATTGTELIKALNDIDIPMEDIVSL